MMRKWIVGACAALVLAVSAVVMMSSGDAMAYTCPSGALRPGAPVDSPVQCNIEPDEEGKDVMSIIKNIINVVLGLIGIVTVIMIIYGGFVFLTSQGDTAKVAKGRNTLLYGVVGMAVALLAFAIVNFVLSGVFDSATIKAACIEKCEGNAECEKKCDK